MTAALLHELWGSTYVYSRSPPPSGCCWCPSRTSVHFQPAYVWLGTAGKSLCPHWYRCPGWSSGCRGLAGAWACTEFETDLKKESDCWCNMTTPYCRCIQEKQKFTQRLTICMIHSCSLAKAIQFQRSDQTPQNLKAAEQAFSVNRCEEGESHSTAIRAEPL